MSFIWPLALLSLLAIPLIAAGYVLLDRHRRAQAARFGNPDLLPNLVPATRGPLHYLPEILLLLALTALLVGLARPRAAVNVSHEEAAVVLAIDTSRSMSATDVLPNRLAAAKSAARTFVETVPSRYRVGLVAFASTAAVAASASTDRSVTLRAIDRLRTGSGTSISAAIAQAIKVGQKVPGASRSAKPPPVAVILVSDGAQTVGRVTPAEAAQKAQAAGVKVSTVALGTPDATVNVPIQGGLQERVTVPADKPTLRNIAAITGGHYYEAPTAKRLADVYRTLGSQLGHTRGQRELTSLFAGAGALLLLVAGGLATLLFQRFP